MTQNIQRRLKEHNSGHTTSTKAFTPWILLYSESFASRDEARNREKYLKSTAGRKWIKQHFFS
jgi:putative endonuclease